MKIYILPFSISFFCHSLFSQNPKEVMVKSTVKEVTVFINKAQVTRSKLVEIGLGKSTIRFKDLSPFLDAKSVQLSTGTDLHILSVNTQSNYMDSTIRPAELLTLYKQLENTDYKLKVENVNLQVILEEIEFLKKNRTLGGKNQELSLTNLKQTSGYYRERILALKLREIEVNKLIEDFSKEKDAIANQIGKINLNKINPRSEVVVEVDATTAGKINFELSYLVSNAGWHPSYDIKAKSIDAPIELIYKANVHQDTKEEWTGVKLKLSSSNPDLGNIAPQLKTYYLDYGSLPPQYENLSNEISGRVYNGLTNQPMPDVTVTIQGTTIATTTAADGSYSLSLPQNASEISASFTGFDAQTLSIDSKQINFYLGKVAEPILMNLEEAEVSGYSADKKMAAPRLARSASVPMPVRAIEKQTSFEFEAPVVYTIPSGSKAITVDMNAFSLKAGFEYYSIPKIDKDAFLVANITDWEKYNLLEGEANIFFENTFVGKSILDTRFISDTLTISLGRDRGVSVKRDKISDYTTRQFMGAKKEISKAWRINVKNNKHQSIHMLLFDQIPVSTLQEIEVSVDNISEGNFNKDKGEIRWVFDLAPGGKKEIELKYKVKYPKNKDLIVE